MYMFIPATPTPYPQAFAPGSGQAPLVTLPSGYTIWGFADDTVGVWNRLGATNTQVIQVALILVIVFISIYFIVRLLRSLSDQGETT